MGKSYNSSKEGLLTTRRDCVVAVMGLIFGGNRVTAEDVKVVATATMLLCVINTVRTSRQRSRNPRVGCLLHG